ncbi:MAG: hypothetical protein WBE72_11060 [Terracidiphilus sp.]
MRNTFFAFGWLILAAPALLSAQSSDRKPSPGVTQAVEAAFPPDLHYAGEPPSNPYDTCAAVFSRDAGGAPNLIAAAYSGDGAEVAMLAYAPGGARIISTITNRQFWLTDGECGLQMVNLADPASPDSPLADTFDVSFDEGPDWFFIWDGKKLQNITALQTSHDYTWRGKEVPNSAMYQARVVDVDHHGAMQIAGNNGDWDKFPQEDGIASTGTDTLFRYNGTTYAPAKALQYSEEYEPNLPKSHDDLAAYKVDAAPWTQGINMHRTPAPSYQLRIVNGDRGGSNRVTSAKVEINGATIVLPNEVNQGVETLARTIQLQKQNMIKVTVDGPAKSHIYVTIE